MVKISRLPKPAKLEQKGQEWTDELCEEREEYYRQLSEYENGNLSKKPKHPRAQSTRYAHQEIKAQLQEMSHRKCVYCEKPVADSPQHVEHFRPQSIYPRLAYEWDNLLLACTSCNSKKRDKFPLLDGSQALEDRNDPCALDDSDDNALVNPCVDDPRDFFDFEDEWIVCRNARAQRTREVCGLNREALKDQRRFYLALVEVIAKSFLAAQAEDRARERTMLKKCLASSAPYTAMVWAKLVALGIDIKGVLNHAE
jgi:uncharacterized protein (TIGR02646 family)